MYSTAIDVRIDELEKVLRGLPPDAAALFSAACTERLAPFYEHFSRIEKWPVCEGSWGEYGPLRTLLDSLWLFLRGERHREKRLANGLDVAYKSVPDADTDYDIDPSLSVVGSHFALCFCCCLDYAIALAVGLERRGTVVEDAVSGLRMILTFRETGFFGLGSDPRAIDLDAKLLDDPLISQEFRRQDRDLARLAATPQITAELVDEFRGLAVAERYDPEQVLRETDAG